jgi:hypothetical protein
MTATHRIAAAVLAVAAASAVLTGCGGDDDAADAPIVRPAATTADSGPLAGQSADQVLSEAREAMKSAGAVIIDAHLTDDNGQELRFTSAVAGTGKCASVIHEGPDSVQLIGIGETYYLKGDAQYWRDAAGDVPAQTFAGKWAKLPAKAADSFDGMCRVDPLVDIGDVGPVTRGAATTKYGASVVPLRRRDDDGTVDTAYVAATGTPYVLGLANTDVDAYVRFTGFGKAVKISAPPAGETVDLSSVGSHAPDFSV